MKAVWRIPRWIAVGMIAIPLAARSAEKPTESEHRRGPHGLEGWTLDAPVPDSGYGDERFAFTLVLARDGHVLNRIGGDPFIWKWLFWADGRQVAYETGPFHFGMTCIPGGRAVRTKDVELRLLSRITCERAGVGQGIGIGRVKLGFEAAPRYSNQDSRK